MSLEVLSADVRSYQVRKEVRSVENSRNKGVNLSDELLFSLRLLDGKVHPFIANVFDLGRGRLFFEVEIGVAHLGSCHYTPEIAYTNRRRRM